MEGEKEQEPSSAFAGGDEGEGKEGRKRKQAMEAEDGEEKPTDPKQMKLDGERGGEGEESLEQEQVCEEEKKEVKHTEESDEVEAKAQEGETDGTEEIDGPQPKLGAIADDGGELISRLVKRKPYEHKFCYQQDKLLYEGPHDTTKDGKSLFQLKVEMDLAKGEVLLSLELRPKPEGSSPPLPLYNFKVTLVGETGEDKWGCAMSVLLSENENLKVEKKQLENSSVLDMLREKCSEKEMITFRVVEQPDE